MDICFYVIFFPDLELGRCLYRSGINVAVGGNWGRSGGYVVVDRCCRS